MPGTQHQSIASDSMVLSPSLTQRLTSVMMPTPHRHLLPSVARKGEGCSSPRRCMGRMRSWDVFVCAILALAIW